MAYHKSAVKKARQDRARRARNRSHSSRLRTTIKTFRKALEGGDVEAATAMLRPTLSLVDHSAKLGLIPANAAARTKSRLTRALNKLAAGA